MKFSIAIPAFKAKYLYEAISSCLAQTYKDFEIIVVDDASPEDLRSVVLKFDDSRLKYFRNEVNCGAVNVVDNWNICLGHCAGDYVICMGDDDRLTPDCLQEYSCLLNKYPRVKVLHALTVIIDENGERTKMVPMQPEYEDCMQLLWNHWTGCSQYIGDFCYEIDTLRKDGGFYKLPLAWGSDVICSVRAAAYDGIANTQMPCFEYRESRYTISKGGNSRLKIETKKMEKQWLARFLKANEDDSVFFTNICKDFDNHYQKEYLQYFKEYLQESLNHIFPSLVIRRKYNISLSTLLLLFLRVVKYKLIK